MQCNGLGNVVNNITICAAIYLCVLFLFCFFLNLNTSKLTAQTFYFKWLLTNKHPGNERQQQEKKLQQTTRKAPLRNGFRLSALAQTRSTHAHTHQVQEKVCVTASCMKYRAEEEKTTPTTSTATFVQTYLFARSFSFGLFPFLQCRGKKCGNGECVSVYANLFFNRNCLFIPTTQCM